MYEEAEETEESDKSDGYSKEVGTGRMSRKI